MILNEQTYKNLNRPYYIGRMKGYDKSKALHKLTYLTTDLKYAILYSKYDGYIEEYRLKSGINVFNARSKSDYLKLRLALLKDPELNTFTSCLDNLKDEDWSVVLKGFGNRDKVINLLKSLGYDGFFNYEYTNEVAEKLRADNEIVPVISNEPAIGVLDADFFNKVGTITSDELQKTDAFKDFKKLETADVKSRCFDFMVKNKLPRELTKAIISNVEYFTLTDKEKDQLVDEYRFTDDDKDHYNWMVENTNFGIFNKRLD